MGSNPIGGLGFFPIILDMATTMCLSMIRKVISIVIIKAIFSREVIVQMVYIEFISHL
jgi:hypothetical protein